MSFKTPSTENSQPVMVGKADDTDGPLAAYTSLKTITGQLASMLTDAVITPVAKQHFEDDRGIPVTQVLPDKTENYEFECNGFEALILPDERRVTNFYYDSTPVTQKGFLTHPDQAKEIIAASEELWCETFGEYKKAKIKSTHPGPFPLQDQDTDALMTSVGDLHQQVVESKSLEVVAEAARDENYRLLSDMFGTPREDLLTPGGTDLSAITHTDEIHVPYNDGDLAVLRPTTENRSAETPTRGVVIGHDDTPIGLFAHVIDVTNLRPDQQTTHEAIKDAMGFDRELDPWADIEALNASQGERIRLQGDLRVERTDDVDGFPSEIARDIRIREYRDHVAQILDGVTLPSRYLRGRRSELPIMDVLSITVSEDGDVVLDPTTSDADVELLAYTTALCDLSIGPAQKYTAYVDIPYIHDPRRVRTGSLAKVGTGHAIEKAREELLETLRIELQPYRDQIEQQARDAATEVEAAMDVPRQVNLPVDNHMTFVEQGYTPDRDTEPIPVAVPEESTLHIVHDEHNTVTVQIDPDVYRFSLLPRGLQPPETRPEWPEP